MVTMPLKVGVGDASGEVLVVVREVLFVRLFFGGLDLFFRGAPHLQLFKNPAMIPFCISKNCCIVFRGTSGSFAVSNPLGAFFFVIIDFALRCVDVYAMLLAAFPEVPGNDVFG